MQLGAARLYNETDDIFQYTIQSYNYKILQSLLTAEKVNLQILQNSCCNIQTTHNNSKNEMLGSVLHHACRSKVCTKNDQKKRNKDYISQNSHRFIKSASHKQNGREKSQKYVPSIAIKY